MQLYQVARKDGVKTAGKAAWQGVKSGYTTWLTTSDPTAFGESFGTVLTTAAAVAAPYAKAGVGAKAVSAERVAASSEKAGAVYSTSSADALRLAKNLASREQMHLPGNAMAGAGSKVVLRDVGRLVKTYGGKASDWAKMSSKKYQALDGREFETHWYQNMRSGKRVEFKTQLVK